MKIKLADFTMTPGPRRRFEGEFSAEEWREDHLAPAVKAACLASDFLEVDLDGVDGFSGSFIDEAFNGLLRTDSIEGSKLLTMLKIKCEDEPLITEGILNALIPVAFPEIVITDHETCGFVIADGEGYDDEEDVDIMGHFDHVISIVGTWEGDGDPPGGWDAWNAYSGRKLRLRFDDVPYDSPHGDAPKDEHVQQIIDFAKEINGGRVIIHCAAGVSRSSAAGLIVITTILGADRAQDALTHLVTIRTPHKIRPHRGMTRIGDRLLGCNGQLVAAHVSVWGEER